MNRPRGKRSERRSREEDQARIGIIGIGHWGTNHLRVFSSLPGSRVVCAADPKTSRHNVLKQSYPWVKFYRDYHSLLENEDLDAVVVATPSSGHYAAVRDALSAGLDVLCEKPLALTASECQNLARRANAARRILMVGHILMFNPGVRKLKKYLDQGKLGKIYYIMSVRTNLGPVRPDVDVIYDLATHDISMCNYLLGKEPLEATAVSASYLGNSKADISFITLRYPQKILAHFHVSWLTPPKRREVMIVGDRQIITWDDLDLMEPVRLYAIGRFEEPCYFSFGEFQKMSRDREINSPVVDSEEPLVVQNKHFLECVQKRTRPLSSANEALAVVRALEMIKRGCGKK